MSLRDYLSKGFLKRERTSAREIGDLLMLVERDVAECRKEELTLDWRFNIAYNAALQLCKIVLRSSGFRTRSRSPAHMVTIACLPDLLDERQKERAEYLDQCRSKRNATEYDAAGRITEEEVAELVEEVLELQRDVIDWLEREHPDLLT